jgi:hypothetical protein
MKKKDSRPRCNYPSDLTRKPRRKKERIRVYAPVLLEAEALQVTVKVKATGELKSGLVSRSIAARPVGDRAYSTTNLPVPLIFLLTEWLEPMGLALRQVEILSPESGGDGRYKRARAERARSFVAETLVIFAGCPLTRANHLSVDAADHLPQPQTRTSFATPSRPCRCSFLRVQAGRHRRKSRPSEARRDSLMVLSLPSLSDILDDGPARGAVSVHEAAEGIE